MYQYQILEVELLEICDLTGIKGINISFSEPLMLGLCLLIASVRYFAQVTCDVQFLV